MVTVFKTMDVTNLVRCSKKKHLKFNMLLDYCIGMAVAPIKEFYILPVGDKLIQYDALAVNTVVKNKNNEVSSCDISQSADLSAFNQEYLKYIAQVAKSGTDTAYQEIPKFWDEICEKYAANVYAGNTSAEWYDCVNGEKTDKDYHSAIWIPVKKKD